MANLFPVGYEDEVIQTGELKPNRPIGYRNGVAFDYRNGDFPRDGLNKLLDSDGIDSWKAWCVNCLQTERYMHLAYNSDFGIETAAAMRAASREEAEAILTRQITEAILADPYKRAAYIEHIAFDWTAPDSVEMSVTIHGIDDVSIDVVAYITRGEG